MKKLIFAISLCSAIAIQAHAGLEKDPMKHAAPACPTLSPFRNDSLPKYPGGDLGLLSDVVKYLVYPAKQPHLTGVVRVNFMIQLDGSIRGVHVVQGLRPDYDSSAVYAVRKLSKFSTPGKLQENLQPVSYTVPVRFYKHQ